MKAIYFKEHGNIDVLQFGDLPDPKLKTGNALLKVKAVALNHLDIWVRRGWKGLQLNMPHIGGSDIVGEIAELADEKRNYKIGQRVLVNPGINLIEDEWTRRSEDSLSPGYRIIGEHLPGGLAQFVSVPVANLIPAPEQINDTDLAASTLVGITCWRMLFGQAQLKPGETILIVGSGGGVNLLSLLLAKKSGCFCIVLAGSEKKAKASQKLGADVIIRYDQNPDWQKEILNITKGRGVDLVVDNVGQKTFNNSLKSVRRGGRIVTVGNTSGYELNIDNRLIFTKQVSIIGSTMGNKQDLLDVLEFMQINKIKMPVDIVSPLKDGIKQIARLEEGQHFGKIVLLPN